MFPDAEDTRLAQRRDDGDVPADPIDFLPLGDSYTIGISVDPADRWPDQLVRVLAGTVALRIVANPARNGLTSGDLLRDELPLVARLRPGLVSVLIGVNDVVQGVSEQRYLANVRQILDQLVEAPGAGRVFVVATPDYTLTPQGAAFGDPKANRVAIARFNAVRSAFVVSGSSAGVMVSTPPDAGASGSTYRFAPARRLGRGTRSTRRC